MEQNRPKDAPRPITVALILWVGITAAAIGSTSWLYMDGGRQGVAALVQPSPYSDLHLTLLSVAVSWALLGAFIALLYLRRIHSGNVLTVGGFFSISLLYVNILRERGKYGDIHDYILAATNLYFNEPLHARYIYPPFWATILQPLVPLGARFLFDLTWLLNLVALFAFYFLLHAILKRYDFSARLAALVTFAFMLVNVPMLRTLGYVQVNLHVMNLILLSLLLYPRLRWVSALALSLAVQLKVSPIVLVLAFVMERDVRWLLWFLFASLAITSVTVFTDGLGPYSDFLTNIRYVYTTNGIVFRDSSIDSWFRALAMVFGGGLGWTREAILVSKCLLAGAVGVIVLGCVKYECFFQDSHQGKVVLNATPGLLILMMMASPLVWEHHPIFVALSYLVILKGLSTAGDWLLYGFAYYFEFLVPTFDFFPWSYGRLLSPLVWLILAGSLMRRTWPQAPFLKANEWLTAAMR